MYRRIMHVFYGVALIGLAFVGQAQAVSLGKIDVASHLGEPFYAEVPLALDKGEVISSVFVELAAPSDYRILEVFRDESLNQLRADVKKDSRGTRVELTSDSVMEAPFFNIVLKVRYERATHFKKYPVFLDLPKAAKPASSAPLPTVSAVDAAKEAEMAPAVPVVVTSPVAEGAPEAFKTFDGWARTGRYGPMVFGDTITTVAERLKVDDRYTTQQVMMALFEKNRGKFDKDNINLIKAGTYLDVPSAAEVERIAPSQARQMLAQQEKQWKELTQQPRYAAVAEAQRTRYSKRVRVGEEASGVAAQPMEKGAAKEPGKAVPAEVKPAGEVASVAKPMEPQASGSSISAAQAEQTAALAALKAENDALKTKLADSETKMASMAKQEPSAEQAAAEARIKKLELQLARMQANLDRARQEAAQSDGPLLNWLSYALIGAIVLLIGVAGMLLMRSNKRPHPAEQEMMGEGLPEEAPEAFEPQFEEVREIEVEEVPAADHNATVRMTADEFEAAMGDSIPDLTDEDTSEMEPFQEAEEEADPNVDYLSEADVYLRYGMEEEAEQQVKMALKLRHDNKDAHIKLAEIRKARGDQAGVDDAVANARTALAGDALAAFEAAVASMGGAATAGAAAGLDDTVPPMDETLLDHGEPEAEDDGELSFTSTGEMMADEIGIGEGGEAAASEESDIEFTSTGEMMADEIEFGEETPSAVMEGEEEASLDLGDIEWSAGFGEEEESAEEEQPVSEAAETGEAPAVEESGELDFDFSAFEEEASEDAEPEAEAKQPEAADSDEGEGLDFDFGDLGLSESDEASVAEEAEAPEEVAAEQEESGGMDFDFGGLMEEIGTGEEAESTGESAVEAEASTEEGGFDFGELDLSEALADAIEEEPEETSAGSTDETLSMDWSSDTSSSVTADEEDASESVEELELGGGSPLDLDLDLSGLDVELGEGGVETAEDFDDFSSTLQTNLAELSGQFEKEEKGDEPALDLGVSEDAADLDFGDFGLESVSEDGGEESAPAAEPSDDVDMESINEAVDRFRQQRADDDLDFEATMRLDTLLGEMSKDDSDKDGN